MANEQHRHDISDEVWALLEPHLPGQRGQWGGIAQDNRRFINAVFLDIKNRRSMAGSSDVLWKMGNSSSAFSQMAGQRNMGKNP